MVWRLRMHRIRRIANKALRFARVGGTGGAIAVTLYGMIHDHIHHGHSEIHGWTLALLGLFVLLAGIGHALHPEAPSVQEYADGDTEELPGISKLISGLVASGGGVVLLATGFLKMMA